MLEAGALMFTILGGGVLGGTFAERWFGPASSHELRFVALGSAIGTVLGALAILILPLPT